MYLHVYLHGSRQEMLNKAKEGKVYYFQHTVKNLSANTYYNLPKHFS